MPHRDLDLTVVATGDRLPVWHAGLTDYPSASRFVTVDGLRMHMLDAGQPEARPVLMVHGNPTWSYYYRHLVQALADRYRPIAVDHVGCGLSEKPDQLPYDLDLRIRHLTRLVEQLDLRNIHLVVHDWGGAIGLGAALHDPDRYGSFSLLNTAAFPPPFFPWRIRVCRFPVLGRIAVQRYNLFARAAIRMATTRPGGLPADVASGLLAPWDSWSHRRAIHEFVTDIPTRDGQPTMERLKQIRAGLPRLSDRPIQLLWGMQDWCFRPQCLAMFRTIWPAAQTREYRNAGHYVMEDAREQVIGAVQEILES